MGNQVSRFILFHSHAESHNEIRFISPLRVIYNSNYFLNTRATVECLHPFRLECVLNFCSAEVVQLHSNKSI